MVGHAEPAMAHRSHSEFKYPELPYHGLHLDGSRGTSHVGGHGPSTPPGGGLAAGVSAGLPLAGVLFPGMLLVDFT